MTDEEVNPILEPLAYFGVSPEVKGCGSFLNDYTFAHVSGRLLITEDFRDRRQRYWHIPKYRNDHIINAIAFDQKRHYIAIAEQGDPPLLCVYRLSDYERILYMSPKECKSDKFTTMFLHCDSDRISALLGPPENLIYTCLLSDGTVESVTTAMHRNLDTEVTQIFGHYEDTFHYAIIGIGIFRFMLWMGDIWEDVFRSFNQAEGIPFTCGTYAAYDTIAAGTADGKIYIIAHDGIKGIYDALTVEKLYIEVKKKGVRPQEPITPPAGDVSKDGFIRNNQVQYMNQFTKGFVYVVQGEKAETIHMFLKGRFGNNPPYWVEDLSFKYPSDDNPFPRHGYLKIPVGQVKQYESLLRKNRPLFVITNFAMTHDGKCIALTFSGRFLMILDADSEFPVKEIMDAGYMNFGINRGPIEKIATCLWKSIFVTLSERVLKLYDYKHKRVSHLFTLQDYAYSLCLHPTGFFGLVGFSECVVMFAIQEGFFAPLAKIGVECCNALVFSDIGEVILLADGTHLRLYDTYKYKQKREVVDCQAGKINCMFLCPSRNHVWTSSSTGLIAKTNLLDGNKEYVFQTHPCKNFCLYNNNKTIYVGAWDGSIKEIDVVQNRMTQEVYVRHGQISEICVSTRKHLIFVGTETGYMLILRCPLTKDSEPIFKIKMHYAPIIKLGMSKDENYLISSGKDGSVCLWAIKPKTPDTWLRVYMKNECYPICADYKRLTNTEELQEMFDFEKDYANRQLKLTSFSHLKKYREDLKPLLKCMVQNELEQKIQPEAKFDRFEAMENQKELNEAARDFVLHQEYNYDVFRKMFYEQATKDCDIHGYYKKKEQEFQERFINKLNQMFDETDDLNRYFYGSLFHNFKENVTDYIEDSNRFMKFFKKKMKKRQSDTIFKLRNLIALKSSPRFIKKGRKRKKIQERCKELMQAALHKKIVMTLKFFKATEELQKLRGEYVDHPFDSDNEASLPKQDSISEISFASSHISLVHSDDPLNPTNLKKNLSKHATPPVSINETSDEDGESQIIEWPHGKKNKEYIDKLKNIMTGKQRKFKQKKKTYQTMVWSVPIKTNKKQMIYDLSNTKELSNNEQKIKEKKVLKEMDSVKKVPVSKAASEKTLESETLMRKSFTILKEKGYFKKKMTSGKAVSKGRLFQNAFSKLKNSRRQQQKFDEFISKWKPKENEANMIPLKMPLTRRNHGFILKTDADGRVLSEKNILSQKEQRNPSIVGTHTTYSSERRPTILQVMYSIYIHPETIVKKVPPLHLFKNIFPKSKFKSLLMKYSPSSKLSKLATKHLVSIHLLRLHQNEQRQQEIPTLISLECPEGKKISVRDAIDFDRFSELGDDSKDIPTPHEALSSKDSFISVGSEKLLKSAKSESLASLIAFSGYSQTTLPEIIENRPRQTGMNIVNRSDQILMHYATEKSILESNMSKTLTKSEMSEGAMDENKEKTSHSSSEHEMNKREVLSAPSSLKTGKKSKRWLQLLKTANPYENEVDLSNHSRSRKKRIKSIIKGERELPFSHEMKFDELTRKMKPEISPQESEDILKSMPDKDISALKKLKVIKQISGPSEKESKDFPPGEKEEVNTLAGQSLSTTGKSPKKAEPSKIRQAIVSSKKIEKKYAADPSSTVESSSICSHDPYDIVDLLLNEKQGSPFLRTGKLNSLAQLEVEYGVIPKRVWAAFDPPISKDFMSTLQKHDLISKIQKSSSNEYSSDESDIYSFYKSDSSPFDYDKIHLKDSDLTLWKQYFLEEEEEIKSLKEKTYEEALFEDYEQYGNELTKEDLVRDLPKVSGNLKSGELSAALEDEFLEEEFSQQGTEEELQSAILSEEKDLALKQKQDETEDEDEKVQEEAEEEKASNKQIKKLLKKKEPEKKRKKKKKETQVLDEEAFLFEDTELEIEEEHHVEEVEEDVDEESEGMKLNEYVKFLKKFKGFFITKELFRDQKYPGIEEVEEEPGKEETEEVSENIAPSRESQRNEDPESTNEKIMNDGGDIKKDGPPKVKSNHRRRTGLITHSSKQELTKKCREASQLKGHFRENNIQRLVREVWQWWNELLSSNNLPNDQIASDYSIISSDLQEDGCNSKLQTDGEKHKFEETSSGGSEYSEYRSEDEDEISETEPFQQLFGIIPPKESAPDALISSYNMRLWKKLFGINHPKTVKSYEQLSENLGRRKLDMRANVRPEKLEIPIFKKGQVPKNKEFLTYRHKPPKETDSFKEIILPSISDISYDNIFKKSLPKPKDANAPSDEIESISSPSYIVHKGDDDKNYELFMRQTVRIKTNLKNKIWFVPEGGKEGEYTKGRFYYPGDIWTKGRTSKTLRYQGIPINDTKSQPEKPFMKVEQKLITKKKNKNLKYTKGHKTDQQKAHTLHSKDIKLHIKKSRRTYLLKENMEKVKFVKINMPFGAFYILPFRLKKFWKMLSKAIGNQLTVKLRSEVIKKSRAIRKTTDVYKTKQESKKLEEGPLLEVNIDPSGTMQFKFLFLEKMPLNEKQFSKFLSKTKAGEEMRSITPKAKGREVEISKLPQLKPLIRENRPIKIAQNQMKPASPKSKKTNKNKKGTKKSKKQDYQQKAMGELVAEFFPECRSHHGSFYKRLKLKKWMYIFKENWTKSRPTNFKKRLSIYKTCIPESKSKSLDPFKEKYLMFHEYLKGLQRQKDPTKKKPKIDKNIKNWLKRHMGHYKGVVRPLKEKKNSQKSETACEDIKSGVFQIETKNIKPYEEIKQKVKEWLACHYKYLRKKRRMDVKKPFTFPDDMPKKHIPYVFVQKAQHFERNIKRYLKGVKKRGWVYKSIDKKQNIGHLKKEDSLRKANNIIEYYNQKGDKCKEKKKMPKKSKSYNKTKLTDESLDQLFSTKRWKEAMFEVCSKKEEENEEYLPGGNLYNAQEIYNKLNQWMEPETNIIELMSRTKEILPIKPYLKLHWPESILKSQKKISKAIPPLSTKRKYAEPVLKFISAKDELLKSNKRRILYHKLLKANATVSICGQKLKFLPKGFRARIANLPHRFKLTALDNNYYYLTKLKNHFVDKHLHDLKSYCVNVNQIKESRRQAHELKHIYEQRQEMMQEKLKEGEEFVKELNMHFQLSKQFEEKMRKEGHNDFSKMDKFYETLTSFHNLKRDVDKVVQSYHEKGQKKHFKEAVLELIKKYEPYSEDTVKTAKIKMLHNQQVLKDLKAEKEPYDTLGKKFNNPMIKRIMQANRYVKFTKDQNLVHEEPKEDILENIDTQDNSIFFEKSYLRQQQLKLEKFLKSVTDKRKNVGLNPEATERILIRDLTKKLKLQTVALNKLENEVKAERKRLKHDFNLSFQ